MINSPAKKLTWLISFLTKPLLDSVPAHLTNSQDLINRINTLSPTTYTTFNYPISLDVEALYTSIPPQSATANLINILKNNQFSYHGLYADDIESLLKIILSNAIFTYNNKVYKQIKGLAMGASISSILAILYLHTLESTALLGQPNIGLYARYVDDTFILTTDKTTAKILLNTMNNADPNIKFTLELPNEEKTLALLDFKIQIINGKVSYEFYKKTAKKDIFIHANSALPTKLKQHVIKEERRRITDRCSDTARQQHHLNHFHQTLRNHDYKNTIDNKNTHKTKANRQQPQHNFSYFKFPFINDHINHKIHRVFKNLNLPVRLYNKTTSLSSILKPKIENNLECHKTTCTIKQKNICLQKNVVYQLTCKTCNQVYIGSTIRKFHERYHEHLTRTHQPINNHLLICSTNNNNTSNKLPFTFKFLTHDNDILNLRIREAFHIRRQNPSLNTKKEMEELTNFIDTFDTI